MWKLELAWSLWTAGVFLEYITSAKMPGVLGSIPVLFSFQTFLDQTQEKPNQPAKVPAAPALLRCFFGFDV